MRSRSAISPRAGAGALAAALALLALAGCGGEREEDLVAGKEAFIAKCGSCHILQRAGTMGTVGPNLDQAFQQALRDGFDRSTVEGVVHEQILYPARNSAMPAKLATGQEARDIAAYVAEVVAKGGEDEGLLATVGQAEQEPLAVERNGMLEIPADPNGQLLYTVEDAAANPGTVEISSPNDSSVPHNVAVEGPGVNEVGEVVTDGGVSTITVSLQVGEYQFFCTVPGHREAGMEGALTVRPG